MICTLRYNVHAFTSSGVGSKSSGRVAQTVLFTYAWS
jgi:hypothetical protein